MLSLFRLWFVLGWLMVTATLYLSLMASPPQIEFDFEYIDKMEHFITYFILMFWFSQLYHTAKHRISYAVFFITMGVLIEVLQGLGGVRYFEYADMLANTFGVVIGFLIASGKSKFLLQRFENTFLNTTRT